MGECFGLFLQGAVEELSDGAAGEFLEGDEAGGAFVAGELGDAGGDELVLVEVVQVGGLDERDRGLAGGGVGGWDDGFGDPADAA
ncbi:hypothetical protein GCM10010195_36950 [Kitasatospora griseola]|nr:hypothetical protein [Kitasatospora griseola]GGQ78010.1 hypothetical protein GCM10010195_36950 [Kitasatospora griseola]